MPTYSEQAVRSALSALLEEHGLGWEEFLHLGEEDELIEISPDLDFAFRAVVPSLPESTPTA